MLNVSQVDADTGLAALGVDSLNVVELILICQDLYPAAAFLEDIQINEFSTLREIDSFLCGE
jgi:acyl carrier protein